MLKSWYRLLKIVFLLFIFITCFPSDIKAQPIEDSVFKSNINFFYNPHKFSETFSTKGIELNGDVTGSFGANVNLVFIKAITLDLLYNYSLFFIQRENEGELTRTDHNLKLKLGCILPLNQNFMEIKAGTVGLLNLHTPVSVQNTESYLDSGFKMIGIGKFLEFVIRPLNNMPWKINAELAYMPYIEILDATKIGLPNLCQNVYFSIGTQYSLGPISANLNFFNDMITGGDFQQTKRGIGVNLGINF